MNKKLLAMMLMICMVIGMMPMSAMADANPRPAWIFIKEDHETIAGKFEEFERLTKAGDLENLKKFQVPENLQEFMDYDEEKSVNRTRIVIEHDYALRAEDLNFLKPNDKFILKTGSFTADVDVAQRFTPERFSFDIFSGSSFVLGDKELFGGQKADIVIRGMLRLLNTDPLSIQSDKLVWDWKIPVGEGITIQQDGYKAASVTAYYPKSKNPSTLAYFPIVVRKDFTILKAELINSDPQNKAPAFFYVEDFPEDRILRLGNSRVTDPVPKIENEDQISYNIILKFSGKVIFENAIPKDWSKWIFVKDTFSDGMVSSIDGRPIGTKDGGKTWTKIDEEDYSPEEDPKDPKPLKPTNPQPPVSSGSSSQSSVRPNSTSKQDTKKTEDKKSEDKKQDKTVEQSHPAAEKVSTKLTVGEKKYTAMIDGIAVEKTMDVAPMIHQGRTVLPARMISELLGVNVKYDAKSKTATFVYGENNKVELTLGQKFMMVNGQKVELTAEVLNMDGRILLPLTDIQKAFADLGLKANVGWDANTKSITIDK